MAKKDASYYANKYSQSGKPDTLGGENPTGGAQQGSENANNQNGVHGSNNANQGFGGSAGQNYNAGQNNNAGQNFGGAPNGEFYQDEIMADKMDIRANKVFYILALFGILFFIPLVACPNAKNARFYANQGLIVLLGTIIINVALEICSWITRIFILTGILWAIISWALRAMLLAVIVIGIVWVVQEEKRPLPVIGNIELIK